MTECFSELPYDFYGHRSLVVEFSDLQFNSDAGILLTRQVEEKEQICHVVAINICLGHKCKQNCKDKS